ncbi:sensor histidine kinase [Rhodopirellula halodulae]|uniref:sensor histidine kinase n=1 Tax=Rhodopirellula halodulae TaxID=2894198 RepID=UPI001E6046B2|nr:ATP-binding protein [Rhodopirellula sp. JC737]MCC9656815.1 sensor histidine kinase [Rhodopirellula sp. JC737]
MPLRHVVALLLLIVSPLILIGWFGTSTLARQQQQQREQIEELFAGRLRDFGEDLRPIARRYEIELGNELRDANRDIDRLSQIRRTNPIVRSVMLVDRDGRLIYPQKPTSDSASESLWHAALSELARGRPMIQQTESSTLNDSESASASVKGGLSRRMAQSKSPFPEATQWQSWFHEDGLQLVLWLPRTDQSATGVVLERGRWMADLVEALPNDSSEENGSYELRNSTDRTVYRWGASSESPSNAESLATVRLQSPWNGWRLMYTPMVDFSPGPFADGTIPLFATLIAVATMLLLLGIYVMTAIRRQMNLAQQRVSFASHVSHELRTPLTNIRLYAELAQRDLNPKSSPLSSAESSADQRMPRLLERLGVIEEESQRLSRLVTGVLDMVSGKGKLHPTLQIADTIVHRVVDRFRPTFDSLGLRTDLQLKADQPAFIDSDVMELVLVNLLSNVEKYAGSGDHVQIVSSQESNKIIIDVIDDGPGITRSEARRIFEPFERLDDSLSAPAGTGLGLAIARNAARRHGGELTWIPASSGAHFRLIVRSIENN